MKTPYSEAEVRSLVEAYEAHRARADTTRKGLGFLVRLADLHKALEQIPMDYWEVVLLHGLIGVPQERVAELLQISRKTVSKRYRRGLEDTRWLMNGGHEE
jgi:RNA polymerase sigma factor (sigma-70 family)